MRPTLTILISSHNRAGLLDRTLRYLNEARHPGDWAVDVGYFSGRNTGPIPLPNGEHLPASQKEVRIRGVDLATVRDGHIVDYRLYFDQMEFMGQLGLLPEEFT